MKRMWLLASMLISTLLVAAFAAAEISGEFGLGKPFEGTKYVPYPEPKQQRLMMVEYSNYFPFDLPRRTQVQRILDVDSLDVNYGDLATPGIAGAQRILDERYRWQYGYDLETGRPLLSPYGEKRVLKAEGYGGTPIALEGAMPLQMNKRMDFRARRQRTKMLWLAQQYRRMPVIKRYNPYEVEPIMGAEDLDIRPIYLSEYERLQQRRMPLTSNVLSRQRFLMDIPGISYSELYELAGSGELPSEALFRLQFLGREAVGSDLVYSDLSKHFGEDLEMNSNILNRQVFLRTRPTGLVYYDRFPETRTGAESSGIGSAESE